MRPALTQVPALLPNSVWTRLPLRWRLWRMAEWRNQNLLSLSLQHRPAQDPHRYWLRNHNTPPLPFAHQTLFISSVGSIYFVLAVANPKLLSLSVYYCYSMHSRFKSIYLPICLSRRKKRAPTIHPQLLFLQQNQRTTLTTKWYLRLVLLTLPTYLLQR